MTEGENSFWEKIKEELDKKGFNISKKQIEMESINCFGYHNININLYKIN